MQVYRLYMIIDKQGTVVTLYTSRCVQYYIKMTNHPFSSKLWCCITSSLPWSYCYGIHHLIKSTLCVPSILQLPRFLWPGCCQFRIGNISRGVCTCKHHCLSLDIFQYVVCSIFFNWHAQITHHIICFLCIEPVYQSILLLHPDQDTSWQKQPLFLDKIGKLVEFWYHQNLAILPLPWESKALSPQRAGER